QEPEHHGPDRYRPDAADSAEDEDHPPEERDQRLVVVRAEEGELPCVDAPGEAGQRGPERQRLQAVVEDVFAERRGRVLVLADRAEHPAPRRAREPGDEPDEEERRGPDEDQHDHVLVADMESGADPALEPLPLPVVLRGRSLAREVDRSLRATRQSVLVGRDPTYDLAEGDGDDREVVPAEAKR